MRLTGLSEFLWFLLIFGAMFAFTVWRQQRDRRRREERMAAMSTPVEERTGTDEAPDIFWGRGPGVPVPPPEVTPDWDEAPTRAEPASLPVWTPPPATQPPRRTAPDAPRRAAAGRDALQFRSPAGLRHAMIALTVLGPCRAMEPYGAQWPQQEPDGGGAARPPTQGR